MNIPKDEFILELLPDFIDTWIEDIEAQFDGFLEAENYDDMYRLAHTLKGSCMQFSLNNIADVGIDLMEQVKHNQWHIIAPYKKSLLDKFHEAKQYLIDNNLC
ncbi:MAG: hypothetical protein B7C24_17180 [Bacteroidetes bacterium 4572_77]|nr:MAG: hypothetical protein B7C24_17180 [Bacteroidetes bacterium 4572_77]